MLFSKAVLESVKILGWSKCCITWLTMQCSSNLQAMQTRVITNTSQTTVAFFEHWRNVGGLPVPIIRENFR